MRRYLTVTEKNTWFSSNTIDSFSKIAGIILQSDVVYCISWFFLQSDKMNNFQRSLFG